MQKYLVNTDFGNVVVAINEAASGLAPDLISLHPATPEHAAGLTIEVPLRAFAAKMLEIVESCGVGEVTTPSLAAMMLREKATAELKRIERFARERSG